MVVPGIFEQTLTEVQTRLDLITKYIDVAQVDIADGVAVNGKTLTGFETVSRLNTSLNIDLHLMVLHPTDYLVRKLPFIEKVCAQVEPHFDKKHFIEEAKRLFYKVGLSLNPETSVTEIYPFLDQLDYVQFMAVVPGGQGRVFENHVLEKIRQLRQVDKIITIQVDGGITLENVKEVYTAGADDVVVGSAIFGQPDPVKALVNFKEQNI